MSVLVYSLWCYLSNYFNSVLGVMIELIPYVRENVTSKLQSTSPLSPIPQTQTTIPNKSQTTIPNNAQLQTPIPQSTSRLSPITQTQTTIPNTSQIQISDQQSTSNTISVSSGQIVNQVGGSSNVGNVLSRSLSQKQLLILPEWHRILNDFSSHRFDSLISVFFIIDSFISFSAYFILFLFFFFCFFVVEIKLMKNLWK
jgi:hypothetical protein